VHIGQEIVDLLLIHDLAVGRHLVAAHADDVARAVIIGGHSAQRHILPLEKPFHRRALPSARGIRGVAAVAIIVIEAAARGLLRVQTQLSVTASALLASGQEA